MVVTEAGLAPGEVEVLEPSAQPVPMPRPAFRPSQEIVETEFGGVFYLITVGIDLGLYGDFTMPRSSGIDLPIWDFIALVAERLVDGKRFQQDPIASFLARLAGRRSEEERHTPRSSTR